MYRHQISHFKVKCTKVDVGCGSAYSAWPDPQLDLRGLVVRKGEEEGLEGRAREVEKGGVERVSPQT